MGRFIDLNSRLSEEDKQYLLDRGRGYLIPANERRFGTNEEPREPEPHEQAGSNALSPFYQPQDRQAAVYDVGGAPLPDATLDYNTGRVVDRDNGKTIEYAGPGHTPGAFDLRGVRSEEGFESYDVDEQGNPVDDHIDEDIVDFVTEIPNIKSLKKELADRGVEVDSEDKREDLEIKLAVKLQDLRDEGEDIFPDSEDSEGDSGSSDAPSGSSDSTEQESENQE